jgi:hypothetical protein
MRCRRFYFIGVDKRIKFLPHLETRVLPGNKLEVLVVTPPGAPAGRKVSLSGPVQSFMNEASDPMD